MIPLDVTVWIVTTGIAVVAVCFASGTRMHRRLLPWTAGVLIGVSVFWILPEIAEDRGWWIALGWVLPIALFLAAIDRYAYPICPFCIENLHSIQPHSPRRFARRPVPIGWPLLIIGCIHCFLDGWAIALASTGYATGASVALSYGIIAHKLPESVAVGIVAARLTSSRARALATVGLIQASMLAGSLFPTFTAYRDIASLQVFSIPACACLLLFGFLALEDEWRYNGVRPALRAAAPGLIGCGLAALATRMVAR